MKEIHLKGESLTLRTAYDKQSIFSVKQLSIKSAKCGKTITGIVLEVDNNVVDETWMPKRCIVDYTNSSLHGFAYLYSILFLKDPFSYVKTQTCFTKPCKSVLLFRNNATRFHYKIQRRKFVIFLTLGI